MKSETWLIYVIIMLFWFGSGETRRRINKKLDKILIHIEECEGCKNHKEVSK